MNICEYLKNNNEYKSYYKINEKTGEYIQLKNLTLFNKHITSFNNFIQNDYLYLSGNQIKEIPNNFIQNGNLYLSDNQITKIPNNFKQNGYLDLSHNKITKIPDSFEYNPNYILYLCKWKIIPLSNNNLKIGCKTKTYDEWKKFFENKEYYQTKPDSIGYKEIEIAFNYFYKKFKNLTK